jgi:hypothetical protein
VRIADHPPSTHHLTLPTSPFLANFRIADHPGVGPISQYKGVSRTDLTEEPITRGLPVIFANYYAKKNPSRRAKGYNRTPEAGEREEHTLRGGRFEVVDEADSSIGLVSHPHDPLGRHRFVGQLEGL